MTTGQLTTAACRLATPAITDVMSRARSMIPSESMPP